MSLQDVIASFGTGSYTVTRTAASTTDGHGRMVAGSTSTFVVLASIQPASGRELQTMPEGLYNEDIRIAYTTAELKVGPRPDVVTIDGEAWAAFRVQRWQAFGGTHYKTYLSRQVHQ